MPVFEHSRSPRRHAALVQWCGWPRTIPRHLHERDAEFGFITAGMGKYTAGEHSFTICPGSLFFVPPGVAHGSQGVDGSLHCWVLAVPFDRIEKIVPATDRFGRATQLAPARARRLARSLADLLAEPDDTAFDLGAEYVAASALAALASVASEDRSPPVHPAVETATRLLRAEDGDPRGLTLDALAKRCGVSRSRLTALFRAHHGMSVVQFRNRERLFRCLELRAAHPDLGMTRAAFEAGFGSYSQFYRTFCSVIGCTPADYTRGVGASNPSGSRAES